MLYELTAKTSARAAAVAADLNRGVVVRPDGAAWWAEGGAAMPSESALRQVFDSIDADGSGQLDAAELRRLFLKFGQGVTEVEARAMLDQADADGDGAVGFDEFLTIVSGNFRSALQIWTVIQHNGLDDLGVLLHGFSARSSGSRPPD